MEDMAVLAKSVKEAENRTSTPSADQAGRAGTLWPWLDPAILHHTQPVEQAGRAGTLRPWLDPTSFGRATIRSSKPVEQGLYGPGSTRLFFTRFHARSSPLLDPTKSRPTDRPTGSTATSWLDPARPVSPVLHIFSARLPNSDPVKT